MKIHPVRHQTLAEIVAGRLAGSIIDAQWKPGEQLPAERTLMAQLGVSRTTLRKACESWSKTVSSIFVEGWVPSCA